MENINPSNYDHEDLPPSAASNKRRGKPTKSMRLRRVKSFLKYDPDWVDQTKGSLLVVAGLIAQMSFQAVNNPPGGVWQENVDDPLKGPGCDNLPGGMCSAGTSVHGYRNPGVLFVFMGLNSLAFGASLCVILLIIGGFPLKKRFVVWMLAQAMCWAMGCMTAAFALSAVLVTPTKGGPRIKVLAVVIALMATGLLASLVISFLDTLRFGVWARRKWRKGGVGAFIQCLREDQSSVAV